MKPPVLVFMVCEKAVKICQYINVNKGLQIFNPLKTSLNKCIDRFKITHNWWYGGGFDVDEKIIFFTKIQVKNIAYFL